MDKRCTKVLEKIVRERRSSCTDVYERLADQYVDLSESILAKYLADNPEKAFCSKFAVEIRGIDITSEKLKLGDVVCYESSDICLKDFVDPEKNLSYELFEQNSIVCENLMPFIKALRDRGFQPKVSEVIAPLEMLYPFFNV